MLLPEVKCGERLLPVGKKKLHVCQSLAHIRTASGDSCGGGLGTRLPVGSVGSSK